jgi:hypothetical protein
VARLHAEGAATAAGALDVWIVELETSAFQRLNIIDGDAFQVHFARLIDEELESVEFIDVIGCVLRIQISLLSIGLLCAFDLAHPVHHGTA